MEYDFRVLKAVTHGAKLKDPERGIRALANYSFLGMRMRFFVFTHHEQDELNPIYFRRKGKRKWISTKLGEQLIKQYKWNEQSLKSFLISRLGKRAWEWCKGLFKKQESKDT